MAEYAVAGEPAAVFHFALLEEEVAPVFRALRRILAPTGTLHIQTVYPWIACGEAPYHDGWRTEMFSDLGPGFPEPAPLYFRTLTSWVSLLHQSDYRV